MGYLSTKVKDKRYLKNRFPSVFVYFDILAFLEGNGFKQYDSADFLDNKNSLHNKINKVSTKSNERGFIVVQSSLFRNRHWFRFWGGGQITKDNPIFFVYDINDKNSPNYGCIELDNGALINRLNSNEFANYVNEFFEI